MPAKSIKKNAVFNVIKTLMSMIFPLITFPYASRILLPEGIGKVNFANSIVSYFSLLAGLGIGTYGIREAAKVRNDKIKLNKLVTELLLINLISTVVSYILFFISIVFVPKFFEYRALLLISGTTIIFSTIGINWLYQALEEYQFIAVRSVLFQALSIVFLFVFVHTKDDIVLYTGMGVFASVGSNICNLIHSRKYYKFSLSKDLNLGKHIKPIMILFGSSLAISVFTIMDTSMLGFLSTNTEVGYYSAATKIIRIIRDLFPAVFLVMFAKLSITNSEGNTEVFNASVNKMLNFILCFALPIIAGLLLLRNSIIIVLSGTEYIPAIRSMCIMTPVILFSSWAGFLGGTVLNSTGKEKIYLYCTIAGACINLTLNATLIPSQGSFGASFATVVTEFFLALIYTILCRNNIKKKFLFKNLSQYIIGVAVMFVSLFFLGKIINSLYLKIILFPIIGAVIYAVMLLIQKNILACEIIETLKKKILKNRQK